MTPQPQHNPITECARCRRRFRPVVSTVIVCQVCVQVFATTGNAPGEAVPVIESLAPKQDQDPKEAAREAAIITRYPTPRGICANPLCHKPFMPHYNQRYCSPRCRYDALDRRRLALYGRH